MITGEGVTEGDVVLGLASSGVHSNGYSLVRRIVAASGLMWTEAAPFENGTSLGEALLAPTRMYVRPLLAAAGTGGGLIENIPRVLPDGLCARLDATAWELPPVFRWLMAEGGIEPAELARTFNCGIGMVVVTSAADAGRVADTLSAEGETVFQIGKIARAESADRDTVIDGMETAWRA